MDVWQDTSRMVATNHDAAATDSGTVYMMMSVNGKRSASARMPNAQKRYCTGTVNG